MIFIVILFLSFSMAYAESSWPQYQQSNFDPYKNSNRCVGGGIAYKSPYISVVHLYENFIEQNSQCRVLNKKATQSLKQMRADIGQKAQQLSLDKNCPQLKQISQKFLHKNQTTLNEIANKKKILLSQVKKEAQNPNIQVEASHLAWGYTLCRASFFSKELMDHLDFVKKIEALKFNKKPIQVAKNGETIKDCHNVVAYGNKDLETFNIDISMAKTSSAIVSYNTYSVPDHVKVLSGNGDLLVDSTCLGTMKTVNKQIPINKDKYSKIKFKVDALCEKEEGGTAWQIHFTCGVTNPSKSHRSNEETHSKCQKKAANMVKSLKLSIDTLLIAQESAWMRSLCQKGNYKKVVPDYTKFKTLLSIQSNEDFKRLNLDVKGEFIPFNETKKLSFKQSSHNKISKNKTIKNKKKKTNLNKENFILKDTKDQYKALMPKKVKMKSSKKEIYQLLDQKLPEKEPKELQEVPYVTRHKVTPFVYHYKDFINKKKKYCPPKPKKDGPLFKKVSFAYCYYAFPKLFGPEDDP